MSGRTRTTSNLADDRILVQEIRKHPALYDTKNGSTKLNKKSEIRMKQVVWQKVAIALDIEAVDAKNRYRNLRDRFVREKKRLLKEGEQAYLDRDPWPLLDDMSFLWDFTRHRRSDTMRRPATTGQQHVAVIEPSFVPTKLPANKKRRRSVDSRPQPILPMPSPEWVDVDIVYHELPSTSLVDDRGTNLPGIKNETTQNAGHLTRLLDNQVDNQNVNDSDQDNERDEDDDNERTFVASVASAFKRFTPRMRALAKWRIQQVLYEVEFEPAQ